MASSIILLSLSTLVLFDVGDAQIVECNGSADCQCPTSSTHAGTKCVLQCNAVDSCKGKTLTCRPGDDCEIECGAYASCSSDTVINAQSARNVNIVCSDIDSCKDSIDITCGSGHCGLRCNAKTSCDDWGHIQVSSAASFECTGFCPSNLPATFGIPPTVSPTSTPTLFPTLTPSIRSNTADIGSKPIEDEQETTQTVQLDRDTLLPIPVLSEPLFYVITLAVMFAVCCGCVVCAWLYFQHRHTKKLLEHQLRRMQLDSCSSPKMSTQLHKIGTNQSDACSEQVVVSSPHYKVSNADSMQSMNADNGNDNPTAKHSMSSEATTSSGILYDANDDDDDDADDEMYVQNKRTPGFIQNLFKIAPKPSPKKPRMLRLSPSPSPPSYFKVPVETAQEQEAEYEHFPLPEAPTNTGGGDFDGDNDHQEPDSQCIHSMEGVINCNNCAYCHGNYHGHALPLRRTPTCASMVEEPGACPVLKASGSQLADSPACITPFLRHRKFTSIPSLPTLPHTSYSSRDLHSPYKSCQDLYSPQNNNLNNRLAQFALPSMQLSHVVDDHGSEQDAESEDGVAIDKHNNMPNLMEILSQKALSPRYALNADCESDAQTDSDGVENYQLQNGEESTSETATFIG